MVLTRLSEVGKRWVVGLLAIYPGPSYRTPLAGREIQIVFWGGATGVRVFEEQQPFPRLVEVVEAKGVIFGVQHVSRSHEGPFVDRFLVISRGEGEEPLAVEERQLLGAEVCLDLSRLDINIVA